MKMNPEQKCAGVLIPLFALRGSKDLGIGDVGALGEFIHWASQAGFRLIQLLPVNETGADHSPYNAISSVALDPGTIAATPDKIKDLRQEDYDRILAEYDLTELQQVYVDYALVLELKHRLLKAAFTEFLPRLEKASGRAQKFQQFCKKHQAWLEPYSWYRTFIDQYKTVCWDQWPEEIRTFNKAQKWLETCEQEDREKFSHQVQYYSYVQWIAFEQWKHLGKACEKSGVALMGDMPIGVSYYSADVWTKPELFQLNWSGGAPPEKVFRTNPFTEKWGQNWGVPLYDWEANQAEDFAWWKQRVRMMREIFDCFRVDHILGFFRIYGFPWRPEEDDIFLPLSEEEAAQKTGGFLPGFKPHGDERADWAEMNRQRGASLLKVLAKEAGRFRLIGEDLGVTPDYVRPTLGELEIPGFRIPMWEHSWDGRLIPGGTYSRLSITTYATHDHPPMKAFWDEWAEWILAQEAGGEIQGDADFAREQMGKLIAYARLPFEPGAHIYSDTIREGLLQALFASNSWMAVPMITDILGLDIRFNEPGSVKNTNWSVRLPFSMAELNSHPDILNKTRSLRDMLEKTNRVKRPKL